MKPVLTAMPELAAAPREVCWWLAAAGLLQEQPRLAAGPQVASRPGRLWSGHGCRSRRHLGHTFRARPEGQEHGQRQLRGKATKVHDDLRSVSFRPAQLARQTSPLT